MENQPYLSIVIPAYKEGERIGQNLLEIEKFLLNTNYSYEIIVVVDGSPDNTAEIVKNYSSQIKNIHLINNKENHGKGYVVKQGLLEKEWFFESSNSEVLRHAIRDFKSHADDYIRFYRAN